MPKTYIISPEEGKEARKYMEQISDKKIYRRLEVIALRGEGMKNKEIVSVTQFGAKYVPQIVSLFVREGFPALLTDNRGGNHRKISVSDEQKFLKGYQSKAETGHLITVKAMWLDFREEFGIDMGLTGFYTMLRRNNWRKVMPRSIHPKAADAQEIAASKKLNQK
jgi:transposase